MKVFFSSSLETGTTSTTVKVTNATTARTSTTSKYFRISKFKANGIVVSGLSYIIYLSVAHGGSTASTTKSTTKGKCGFVVFCETRTERSVEV